MDKIIIFIFGSIIGSFLNVCIYRLPKGKSVVTPPSSCPGCNKHILWHDNIPIISYLILGGKCRFCKSRISFRYFLVEALTAALFVSLYIAFGLTSKFYAYALLTSGLIIATFVDFEVNEIPDQVSLGGLVAGLVLAYMMPSIFEVESRWVALFNSLAGAFAGAASIYLMGFLGEIVFQKEAMGGGDVKLMAMIGSFLGWKMILLTFFLAPVFGAAVGLILKIKEGRETIPYGPYLSLAALIAIFFGNNILSVLFYGLY